MALALLTPLVAGFGFFAIAVYASLRAPADGGRTSQ